MRVYPRVEDELNRCKEDNSTLSWCAQLLKDIWDSHKNLSHFINENKVLDKLIDRVIRWTECPEEMQNGCISLLKDLAANLSLDNCNWASSMLAALIEGSANRRTRFLVMESLFCNLPSEMLAKIPSDLVHRLMSCEEEDLETSLSVYKMR